VKDAATGPATRKGPPVAMDDQTLEKKLHFLKEGKVYKYSPKKVGKVDKKMQ